MLIEFSVKNFRSIRDEQRLSFVKGKGAELASTNVIEVTDAPAPLLAVLRSAAIYGPNAAGKTNLLRALSALQSLVIGSAQRNPAEPLPITPFALSERTRAEPSEFEIHFIVDKVRYQYGIRADRQRIVEEWLFAYPKGKAQRWFERALSDDGPAAGYTVKFGESLKGEKELWERVTRPNASLLATAAQLNNEQLAPIFTWFATGLKIALGKGGWNELFALSLLDRKQQARVLEFLQAADFTISDLRVDELESSDLSAMPKGLPRQLQALLEGQLAGAKGFRITTRHDTAEGTSWEMSLADESDGMQKMFCLAGPWMDTLERGNVMVIDGLHDNLHPALVEHLVRMFHDSKLNPKGAQLLFTTHETAILSQHLFRRDQIWFCERDQTQATSVFPLSDFSVRKGSENVEKGYLAGRYGARPVVRPLAPGLIASAASSNSGRSA